MVTPLPKFAYGCSTYDDYACPALHAGYNPDTGGPECNIAEQYDGILRDSPSEEGVVDSDTAKEAWLEAIDYFERCVRQARYESDRQHYENVVEVGEKVAEEFYWL